MSLYFNICCRSAANPDIGTCGTDIGSGTVTATSTAGVFLYQFGNNNYTLYGLGMNYEKLIIVYGCKPA